MTQSPDTETEDDAPITAAEHRARTEGANRNLALLLVGGALVMLVSVFAVVIVVTTYG